MGKISDYRTQSPDDQAAFNRWVTANVVIGSVIATGLIAMAVAGSRSGPPQEVEVARVEKPAADLPGTAPHAKVSSCDKHHYAGCKPAAVPNHD